MLVYKSKNLCPKIFLEVGGSTYTRTRPIQATIWKQNETSAMFAIFVSTAVAWSHDAVGRSHDAIQNAKRKNGGGCSNWFQVYLRLVLDEIFIGTVKILT